MNRHYFLVVL